MTAPDVILRDACRDMALAGSEVGRLAALRAGAAKLAIHVRHGFADRGEVVDRLWEQSISTGLVEALGEGPVTRAISDGLDDFGDEPRPIDADNSLILNAPQSRSSTIDATPFEWCDPTNIPQREWLYGHFLIRRQVSLTVAPGGTGKSSLVVVEALAQVTGRQLLHDVPYGRSRVWLWNGEDPKDELQRRIMAACLHYGVTRDEIDGRLFVDSGRNTEIVIAQQERNGAVVAEPVVGALVETIRRREIDIVRIDPFVSCHQVPENDNGAIDRVAKTFAKVADLTGCAIELVHHSRKTGGDSVEIEHSRGAVSLIGAARAARTLNTMTQEEAERANVDRRFAYVRIDDGKANLAPRSGVARWIKIESVPLGNGPTGGDNMPVVTPWAWPDPLAGVTGGDFDRVAALIRGGRWRENVRSKSWAGLAVAKAMGLDPTLRANRARIASMLRMWIDAGSLVVVEGMDEARRPRPFIEVGEDSE